MRIAFYDTKPYDKIWFDEFAPKYDVEIRYIEGRINTENVIMASGCEAICVFVNDEITAEVAKLLCDIGVKLILLRCAGYNNVDLKAVKDQITVMRVPSYSPSAVAEHAAALILAVNRKTHRAYVRTKEFNFNINGLMGFGLDGKTAGIIGTGKIGQSLIRILKGFGMNILAYDVYPNKSLDVNYVKLDTLLEESDVISLHCPLLSETYHMINKFSIGKMKDGVILINTSRGSLIDTDDLIDGLKSRKIYGVGLDVYEEEDEYFFQDKSDEIMDNEQLAYLMTFPNVLITSHQAFFTEEAMMAIARTTLDNFKNFMENKELDNEVVVKETL